MSGSLNKVTLIGRVGIEPEIRRTQEGRKIAKLLLVTDEFWNTKTTEWHKIVVLSPILVDVVENYVSKGSRLYLEGSLQARKWTDDHGKDQYITEVILQNYRSTLTLLDSKDY